MKKRLLAAFAGLLLVFGCLIAQCLGSSSLSTTTAATTPPPSSSTPLSLPSPSAIPSPSPRPSPTSTISFGKIPRLSATDVVLNLKDKGFHCSSPERGHLGYTRTCSKSVPHADITVTIYGDQPLTVGLIEVQALASGSSPLSPSAITPILGYIATIPFVGLENASSLQTEARQWVEQTLPALAQQSDNANALQTTQIGPVYLSLLIPNTGMVYSLSLSAKAP